MLKSYYVFMFIVVCTFWFTGHEVKCGKNDLEFWEPQRRVYETSTKHVQTDDIDDYNSDDDEDDDDTSIEASHDGTQNETESENMRRSHKKQDEGHRSYKRGRKNETTTTRSRHSRAHTKQSITDNTKRSRTRQRSEQETKPTHRNRAHTKTIGYDDDEVFSPRPKIRNRFKEKGRELLLRSTRMPPNYEMQQLVDDSREKEQTASTTTKKSNSVPIDELSPFSIARQLSEFAKKFPLANIIQEVIGRTAEFNDIVLLKITENIVFRSFRADEKDDVNKFIDEVPAKKIVFIVHGLSVMGLQEIPCFNAEEGFTQLLSYYFKHLDKFDIFLIPMANPDGVAVKGKFWNKNNSPQTDCPGVSLDRNFHVAWNGTKGMTSCSQHYPGPTPFSEAETRAIRDLFHRYSNKIAAYLHVHAATHSHNIYKGDAVLYPKGYTEVQSDDDKYIDLKGEIDEAMKNASFRFLSVAVETLHSWYGPISGSSVDYASTVYGIPYAMEVVFQSYHGDDDTMEVKQSEIVNNDMALIEIWRRMIDVIFNNIWKYSSPNEAR